MVLRHLLGFLGMGARKKVTLLLAAQRSSLGLAALQGGGAAASWSRATGSFSVGFAEIEPECDSRVNGDTPADVLPWVVRLPVRETQVPPSLPRTSKLPAGTGDNNIK